jgi:anti-anti-sigma factor
VTDLPLWQSRIREQDDCHVVALTGELDLAAADELNQVLAGQLDRPDPGTVVVDLSEVTFLDSAALGALIKAFQRAQEIDRRFVVARPVHGVRRVMQIAGVYELLSEATPAAGE